MCQGITFGTNNKDPDVITMTMLRLWTTSFTADKENKGKYMWGILLHYTNKIYFQLVIIKAFLLRCDRVVINILNSFIMIYVISLHKTHGCIHKWTQ